MNKPTLSIPPTLLKALRDAVPNLELVEWKVRSGPNEAVFLQDGTPIPISSGDANPQGEGINVVFLNISDGKGTTLAGARSFDTAGPNGTSEAGQLLGFLEGRAPVMLTAIEGTATTSRGVLEAFERRGSRLLRDVVAGDGWVFLGMEWNGEGIAVAEQRSPQGTAEVGFYLGTTGRLAVPPGDVPFIHAVVSRLLGKLEVDDVLVAATGEGDDARVELFGTLAGNPNDDVRVRVTLRRAASGRQAQDGALEGVLRTIVSPGGHAGLLDGLGVPASLDVRPLLVYASNTDRTNDPYRDPAADVYLNQHAGGSGATLKPTGGRYGRGIPLVKGLTLFAPLPETSAIAGTPEAITKPLKAALEYLDVDGGDVEVTLGAEQATVLVRLDGMQSFIDTDPLKVTFSRRQSGFTYHRKGEPGAGNRPLRTTGRRPGEDKPAPTMKVDVEADADIAVAFDGVGGLGFPKDDTARMTLGLIAASGGSVTGWMRVREDAVPWNEPFGIPGVTVNALYTAVDLARRKLQAFFGDVTVAGVEAQLALRIAAKRAQNLAAFRLVDDVPLFGWLGSMVGVSVPASLDGIKLKGMGRADGLDGKAIDPADYNVYVVPKAQRIDGKTFPAGFSFHGTLLLWTIGLSADMTLTCADDGSLHFRGAAAQVTLGDVGGISLGLAGKDLPFDLAVDGQGQVYVSVPYHLAFLGLSLSGKLCVNENGPQFVPPDKQRIGRAHFRVTRLSAGKDLSALGMGAEVTYEWSVSVDDLDLPDSVTALSPIKEVEAQATLTFTLNEGALTAELTGRVSGLGDLPSTQVTVSQDDLANVGNFIEKKYEDAIEDLLKKLEDPFGNLPILGDALRFLYGLADESLGRLLSVADALGVKKLPGVGDALKEAGLVAGEMDKVLGNALDWARKGGIPVAGSVGQWAVDAVSRGLGIAEVAKWVKEIPGVSSLDDFLDGALGGFESGNVSFGDISFGLLSGKGGEAEGSIGAVIDDGHVKLAQACLVVFVNRDVQAFPPGSYPDITQDQLVAGLLIPRGWRVMLYELANFGGKSREYIASVKLESDLEVSAEMSGHTDMYGKWRSMKMLPLDQVWFFEDENYQGDRYAVPGGRTDTNKALKEASSMLVPPGWTVRLTNDQGRVLDFTGSVDSFKKATAAFYEKTHQRYAPWNDDIEEARVTRGAPKPVDWQMPRVAWGYTEPGDWQNVSPGTEIKVDVKFNPSFEVQPVVLASLTGTQSHFLANGVNAFSKIGPDGCTLSVNIGQGDWLTPEKAKAWGWRIQWFAFLPSSRSEQLRDADPFAAGGVSDYVWQKYEKGPPNSLTKRLDTVQRWRSGDTNPPMLTSLKGSSASDAVGIAAPYGVGPNGADIYVVLSDPAKGQTLTPDFARQCQWAPMWVRPRFGEQGTVMLTPRGRARLASGRTTPGREWKQYVDGGGTTHADTITLWIDTSRAGFNVGSVPLYVSQITGDSSHFMTIGASAIYEPAHDGFRVYVRFSGGGKLTPDEARQWKWHIQWIGVDG